MTATTVEQRAGGGLAWYALSASDVTTQMGVDADTGLTVVEAKRRQAEYGRIITSATLGREWIIVLALSLLAPAVVTADKILRLRRHTPVPDGEA
jgi:Cation transporter/ATPase, N-terminus